MRGYPSTFAFAAALLFAGGASAAGVRPGRSPRSHRAEAEFFYQAGVEQYAYGRFPEALASFQEALRRNPRGREARIALERVRQELALTAAEAPAPRQELSAAPRAAAAPSLLSAAANLLRFESRLAAEWDRTGRMLATQGRISQLLAERKRARALGRRFRKEAELLALSRRLS